MKPVGLTQDSAAFQGGNASLVGTLQWCKASLVNWYVVAHAGVDDCLERLLLAKLARPLATVPTIESEQHENVQYLPAKTL